MVRRIVETGIRGVLEFRMKNISFVAVLVIGLALTAIFLEPWRESGAQDPKDEKSVQALEKIRIKKEKGPEGHQTIGIVEDSVAVDSRKELPLTFRTLMTWQYDEKINTSPPKDVRNLNDRKVRLAGFMYPLQEGASILYFCLLRTTQTCCYGPRPQYNQYVFVEMKKPTRFHRLDPVSCVGTFKVEPTPEEGFIYRMEGNSCETSAR
jgi:Protein of unknown function (DUF3299)